MKRKHADNLYLLSFNAGLVSVSMVQIELGVTFISLTLFLQVSASLKSTREITHQTKLGSVLGVKISRDGRVELYRFLNIPYARPPVERHRFTKPVPFGSWNETLNATVYGPACPQIYNHHFVKYGTSEDCLRLNIYAPPGLQDTTPRKAVMVWVHGGSYTVGAASFYDGSMLAKTGNVIVVTINYRLGLLGFLAFKNSTVKGNFGLWDQMLAVRWIKDNIDDYGGDPNNITIFGQSAGGFSVGFLALIPHNKGLFRRVIMQSGVPNSSLNVTFLGYDTYSMSDAMSLMFCPFFKQNLEMRIICLRYSHSRNLTDPSRYLAFAPVVDQELFNESPEQILKNQNSSAFHFFRSLDIIVTNCDVDGSVLFPALRAFKISSSNSTKLFWTYGPEYMLGSYYGKNKQVLDEVSSFYGFQHDSNFQDLSRKWTELYTDLFFNAPSTEIVNAHCNNLSSTFRFVITRKSPVYPGLMYNESSPPRWFHGAAHSDDIVFLFLIESLQVFDPNTTVTATKEDLEFASKMRRYWSNFAKKGNPNDESLPFWPSYNTKSRRYMLFGPNISPGISYRNKEAEFWLKTIPNIHHPYGMSNVTVTSLISSTRDLSSSTSCRYRNKWKMFMLLLHISVFNSFVH